MENSYEPVPTTKISNEEESDKNYEIGISFSADKSYDNPDKKLSLSYSFDTHPIDDGFETVIQGGNESSSSHSSKLQSQEFDLSYSSPLNDKSKFELGYSFGGGNNDETMFYSLYVDSVEETTNQLDMNGNVMATSLSTSSAYNHPEEIIDKKLFVKK